MCFFRNRKKVRKEEKAWMHFRSCFFVISRSRQCNQKAKQITVEEQQEEKKKPVYVSKQFLSPRISTEGKRWKEKEKKKRKKEKEKRKKKKEKRKEKKPVNNFRGVYFTGKN